MSLGTAEWYLINTARDLVLAWIPRQKITLQISGSLSQSRSMFWKEISLLLKKKMPFLLNEIKLIMNVLPLNSWENKYNSFLCFVSLFHLSKLVFFEKTWHQAKVENMTKPCHVHIEFLTQRFELSLSRVQVMLLLQYGLLGREPNQNFPQHFKLLW